MPGVTSLLLSVRREIAQMASQSRVRFSEMQKQIDSLEQRLDKIDKPINTQRGSRSTAVPPKPADMP